MKRDGTGGQHEYRRGTAWWDTRPLDPTPPAAFLWFMAFHGVLVLIGWLFGH